MFLFAEIHGKNCTSLPGLPPAAPAAGEVACSDAVGVQNCRSRWAGGKFGMYISSGGYRCKEMPRMDGNGWQECNATGNSHSIPAWEFYVTGTERTLSKRYRWSPGLVSFPTADPEGRFPANKKIHEHGIVRREEFVSIR